MDEVKLYENDYEKPALDDEFLEHHGIMGQKWGVQNGPPYPLGPDKSTGKRLKESGSVRRKKRKQQKERIKNLKKARAQRSKNAEERKETAKTKEQIIKSRDAKSMLKNVDKFTTNEIRDFINRENAINDLGKIVKAQVYNKMSKGEKVKKFVVDTSKTAAKNAVETIIKNTTTNTINELTKKLKDRLKETQTGD